MDKGVEDPIMNNFIIYKEEKGTGSSKGFSYVIKDTI